MKLLQFGVTGHVLVKVTYLHALLKEKGKRQRKYIREGCLIVCVLYICSFLMQSVKSTALIVRQYMYLNACTKRSIDSKHINEYAYYIQLRIVLCNYISYYIKLLSYCKRFNVLHNT